MPEEEEPTVPERKKQGAWEEKNTRVPEKGGRTQGAWEGGRTQGAWEGGRTQGAGGEDLLHVLEEHGLIEAVQRQHFNLNEDEGGEEEALFEDDESCNSESCEVLDEAAAPQLMSNVSPCCTFYHR